MKQLVVKLENWIHIFISVKVLKNMVQTKLNLKVITYSFYLNKRYNSVAV